MDNWRLNHLKSLLEEDPQDEFVRYALAQEYIKLDLYPEGLSQYLKLRELNPDYVGLYYHLAALYAELEDSEKALETYNQGIAIAKKLGDHHALSELMNAKMNFELEM